MKKLSILLMTLTAFAVMSSCTAQGGSPKANLKTGLDSLSYALGLSNSQGLLPYLDQQGIDSTLLKDFFKGFNEGASIDNKDKSKFAYFLGLQVGKQVSDQRFDNANQLITSGDSTQKLSKDIFLAGFIAGTLQKDMKMDENAAQMFAETKMQEIQAKQMENEYGNNKETGAKFLEENKSKEGVITLPSGLQYKVITEGKGAVPTTNDKVRVHYKGTLIDGTEFDSSIGRGEPAEFGTTQVIKGWTEALTMMPVGSKWMLYIPSDLAYGAQNSGPIKPFSTLIFEVELLDIVK